VRLSKTTSVQVKRHFRIHDRIHSGCPNAAAHDLDTRVGEDLVEHGRIRAVPVPDEVLHLAVGVFEVHHQVPGDRGYPRRGGMCSRAEDPDAAAGVLDDREDVYAGAGERDRLDDIGRQQRLGL